MKFGRVAVSLTGAAALIASLTVISRLLGFGRWLTQAATVQASTTGNAYGAANTIPNILYEVVAGGALAAIVVPVLAGPLARKMRSEVNQVASALLTWALIILIPLALVVSFTAGGIAEMLPVPAGSDPQIHTELTKYFLIIFAPQIVLYGVGVVLTGILQAQRRFLAPAVAPIASSMVVIVSYLIFGALAQGFQDEPQNLSDVSLVILAWGTTAGVAALSLPLLVPVWRSGVRLRPQLRFPEGVAPRVARLAAAGVGSLLAQQFAILVVLLSANLGGTTGTYNIFQYTNAVYLLPYAVLVVPLATAVFPRISELADTGLPQDLRKTVGISTRGVFALATFGAALLFVVAPATEAIFASWGSVDGMTEAVEAMALAVIGFSIVFHAGRILFVLDHSRIATFIISGGWLLVALASWVGVSNLAPDGGDSQVTLRILGGAHSFGLGLAAVALLWVLHRQVHFHPQWWRTVGVSLCAGIGGGLLARFLVDSLMSSGSASIVGAVAAMVVGTLVLMVVVFGALFLLDRRVFLSIAKIRA